MREREREFMVVRGTWIGTLASEDKRCVQKDKARKRVFCVFFHFLLGGGEGGVVSFWRGCVWFWGWSFEKPTLLTYLDEAHLTWGSIGSNFFFFFVLFTLCSL